MINKNLLKAALVARGVSVEEIAKQIGMDPTTFYRKMANNAFYIREADKVVKALNLSADEAVAIFFAVDRA